MVNTNNNPLHNRQCKDTEKEYVKQLYSILEKQPLSRRMAATLVGYPDQTYMVTQCIYDWIKQGKAEVVGIIKCTRSGRFVEAITTNPELFNCTSDNQLNLFE